MKTCRRYFITLGKMGNPLTTPNPQPTTIFFDGECNLCSGSVRFILKRDRHERFRFASLQGKSGQALLTVNQFSKDHFNSFILLEGDKVYTRSTAALRVCKYLGGIWSLLYVFIIVPRFIRDGVYDFISGNRYAWFGKRETCWLPEPRWEKRFLP
jgi:predicted DCC family thiol-disulfide oxidoreductase YuxK